MAWSPLASKRALPVRRLLSSLGVGLALLIHLQLLTAPAAQAVDRPAADRATALVGHVEVSPGVSAAGLSVFITPIDMTGNATGTPAVGPARGTVTDADGGFTFEGVAPGRVAVIVSSGETSALPEAAQVVNVVAGRRNAVNLQTRRPAPGQPESAAATFNFLLYKGEYYNNKTSLAAADPVSVTAPNTTSGINLDLATGGGTIAGKVTADATSAPLKDLVVFAFGRNTQVISFDRTDASGDYRISGVPADSFLVTVNALIQLGASDYVGEYYNNTTSIGSASYVKVAEAQNVTGINFGLALGGKIAGKITADVGGGALSFVSVTASGVAPLFVTKTTSTDASGNYTLNGLTPGSYTLEFSPDPSHLGEYYNNRSSAATADPVVVTAGNTATANAGLASAGQITGRVTNSSTSQPIDGVLVSAAKVGDPLGGGYAVTAADGTYSIGALGTGGYKVSVPELSKWYNDRSDEATADVVNVTAGATVPNINISGVPIIGGCTVDPGSRISIGGLVSSGGQPVADAEVNLYFSILPMAGQAGLVPTRFPIAYTTTGPDGRYLFDCLDEYTYYVECAPGVSDYIGQWFSNADSANAEAITLTPGNSRDNVNFVLQHGGKISGRVTTGGSTGLASVFVSAVNTVTGDVFEAITDNSGNYTISSGNSGGLPTGTYKVWTEDHSTANLALLPVTLARFEAVPALGGIALEWRTAEETNHAGFHVYRADSPSGEAVRLTDRMISGGPDYRFVDETVTSDRSYWYWLGAVDRQGREERLGPVTASFGTPAVSKLLGIFPNPLHAQSVIHFSLATAGKARVQIFDPSGRLVRTLADRDYPAGRASVTWDGLTDEGASAHAGVYFVQFTAGVARGTAKVIVAR